MSIENGNRQFRNIEIKCKHSIIRPYTDGGAILVDAVIYDIFDLLSSIDINDITRYVRENIRPENVFGFDVLKEWAESHGFNEQLV